MPELITMTFQIKCNCIHYIARLDIGSSSTLCLCMEHYAPYPINGTCLLSPTRPGDNCHPIFLPCTNVPEALQCSATQDPFCKCDDPSTFTDLVTRSCLPLPAYPGDACHPTMAPCDTVPHTECLIDSHTDVGVPYSYKCFCDSGFFHDSLTKQCLQLPTKPGDSCEPSLAPCLVTNNTDCVLDSATGSYTCRCKVGLFPDTLDCLPLPLKPGDRCDPATAPCSDIVDTECVINSQPDDGDVDHFRCMCTRELICFYLKLPTPSSRFTQNLTFISMILT
jgi:hypothetical protein